MCNTESIAGNLKELRRNIAFALAEAGREADSCSLVAVTKTCDRTAIVQAIAAGQTVFGENRVQEALEKWPELKSENKALQLRLIGPLQTNKARQAVTLFDVIETLDRLRLASKLAQIRDEGLALPELFVQVNIGEEPQKTGVTPNEAPAFLDSCRTIHGLTIDGLMCVPPAARNPTPYFALLREIGKREGVERLSMGMSADFALAIAMGATGIRVGSAIFGERPTSSV